MIHIFFSKLSLRNRLFASYLDLEVPHLQNQEPREASGCRNSSTEPGLVSPSDFVLDSWVMCANITKESLEV